MKYTVLVYQNGKTQYVTRTLKKRIDQQVTEDTL